MPTEARLFRWDSFMAPAASSTGDTASDSFKGFDKNQILERAQDNDGSGHALRSDILYSSCGLPLLPVHLIYQAFAEHIRVQLILPSCLIRRTRIPSVPFKSFWLVWFFHWRRSNRESINLACLCLGAQILTYMCNMTLPTRTPSFFNFKSLQVGLHEGETYHFTSSRLAVRISEFLDPYLAPYACFLAMTPPPSANSVFWRFGLLSR